MWLMPLQFAVFAAYAGRLETAFLTDEVASANAVLRCPTSAPASPESPPGTVIQPDAAAASAAPQQAPKVCMRPKPHSQQQPLYSTASSGLCTLGRQLSAHLLIAHILIPVVPNSLNTSTTGMQCRAQTHGGSCLSVYAAQRCTLFVMRHSHMHHMHLTYAGELFNYYYLYNCMHAASA